MSLIHMKGSFSRGAVLTVLAFAPAFALPQVTTTTTTAVPRSGAAAGARARCAGCTDSARVKQELLLTRLDSLRWEFSNRRMTSAEQDVVVREMDATMTALRQYLENNGGRLRMAPQAQGGAMPSVAIAGTPGMAYTITVQKRGYLGITFDGPSYGYPPEQPNIIRFIQYPKIASVDPASPAERAGLLIGDTLVAMGGIDVVEQSITLSKLLVPDEKLTLKVRRDGDAKEFRVVVGEAPAYVARRVMPSAPMRVDVPMAPGVAIAQGGAEPVRARSPRPEMAPTPAAPPVAWDERQQPARLFVFASAIAGARVESVTEGLGKAFGVKEGVLVIQAPPGSPAYVSGLRDGDVIITAAGTAIANLRQLGGVLSDLDRESGVKLVIVRDKKQQDVMLRFR